MTRGEGMTKRKDQIVRDSGGQCADSRDSSVVREEADGKRIYDLEERTARFGEVSSISQSRFHETRSRIASSVNWWALEPASEPITSKPMMRFPKRNF